MYEAVKLALRKGITDVTPAHFVFTIVQTLRPGDEYSQRDVLCVIEDGQVTYDRMSDVLNKPSNPGTPPAAATAGQRNALRRAKDYLEIFAFSYDGLVDQLEYEQFTPAEARYGADWCGANWYRQAVRSAESYLELHGFSRQGLIDQLEFEGFTHDQAVYAVRRNGY
ncbi:MAG: Ltp family lipoprotein [Clostridia bacterium]|nr:Ltp family lipoprotein [Clostridia bacterium]